MKKRITTIMILAAFAAAAAHSQSGGEFKIEASVIASGGASGSDRHELVGTVGQPVAGPVSIGGAYRISAGFWQSAALIPTSAPVTVGGRVITPIGQPISGTTVLLTDTDGNTQMAVTNPFGYYRFDSVISGRVYIIAATHRRFYFNAQAIVVNENMTEVDITALP